MWGAAAEIAAPAPYMGGPNYYYRYPCDTRRFRKEKKKKKKKKGLFAGNLFYDYSAHVLLNVKMGRQIICVCLSASTSPGVKPKVVESTTMFAEGRGSNNPANASANPMNSSICSIPT